MKHFILLIVTLCASFPFASETVTKSSAAFSFPLTVGVSWKQSFQGKNISFASQSSLRGRKVVEFSWSLSNANENGNISVFNLAGARVKSFPVSSRNGSVQWDVASGKKAAKGVYFAKLTCGTYQKSLKIIIN
jgi:flagellar hook assembly protein FlgD